MQEKEQKISINVEKGVSEVIIREGVAQKLLDPKPPIKVDLSGTIGTPYEYLQKRVYAGQFTQERSHILVNREKVSITLIINEANEYERGTIKGVLEMYPKFKEFGINDNKEWTPTQLGLFFKMNRAFFPDRAENLKLVSELMNFTATIKNNIERSASENGNRTDNFAQVVNSNLPASFVLNIPILKGKPAEKLEIETFANVDGREVSFYLISPSANETLEDIRDKAIDEQLELIRALAPDIAIIEE